jgi:hypothetical protein
MSMGTINGTDDPGRERRRRRWLAVGIVGALLLAVSRLADVAWKLGFGWSDPGHPPTWLYVLLNIAWTSVLVGWAWRSWQRLRSSH